jgi:hypothetical protein
MKKVGIVLISTLALAGAVIVPAALGAARPTVTVQIKSMHKTLLRPTRVHGSAGWITKDRTPRGKCRASSAAGALNAATHGRWAGTYYVSVGGIFITKILGVKPTGSHYWEVLVNNRPAKKGVCSIKLRAGERLLFKIK